jgi:hypothetical protein
MSTKQLATASRSPWVINGMQRGAPTRGVNEVSDDIAAVIDLSDFFCHRQKVWIPFGLP